MGTVSRSLAFGVVLVAWSVIRLQSADGSLVGPSFQVEPPSRVDFANDTGAVVDCVSAGSPAPTVSWLTEGKAVADIPGTLAVLPNGSLHLLPFHASSYRHDVHAATFRCQAANAVGRVISRDVRVHAVVLQEYVVQVYYNKNVIRGNTAVLRCSIPSFVREYLTVTSWVKDDTFNIYPSPKGEGKYHMLTTGELLIRGVDEPDKYHSYQCRAVNSLTGATLLSSAKARFSVTDARVAVSPRPAEKVVTVQGRKDRGVVLPCFSEGNPAPSASWFRMERQQLRPVRPDERVFPAGAGEVLIILHSEDGDAGHWVCVLNNTAGTERVDVTLQLSAPLTVSLQPQGQVTVDVGARTELRCSVAGGPLGQGSPARTWYKDGHQLAATQAVLVLDHVQREDAGMYQCLARTDDDESVQAATQLVLGAARPQLLYKFIRQSLQPGPHVSLKCIAAGNPTPHISWNLDGFPLPQSDRFVIGQYMTLHGDVISHVNISNVQVEDGGIYQCAASNRVGEARHSADLRVYGPPFVRPMPNVSAVAGEPLYIACPAAGFPLEAIIWSKDGRPLPMNRRQHVFPNGTLYLENVQRDSDQGHYLCTAANKEGRSSSRGLGVAVIVPPRINPFAFQSDLKVGDRAGVQCFVSRGDGPLSLEWRKEGQPLPRGVEVLPASNEYISALSIQVLRPEHAGTYQCIATNPAATVEHSSKLVVNVPPRIGPFAFGELIEGARTQVQCAIQAGDLPLSLRWLKDGAPLLASSPLASASEQAVVPGGLGGLLVLQDTYSTTLVIPRVGTEHTGNYTCVAGNAAKTSQLTVPLVVSVPPRWASEPRDQNVTRDQSVAFHCKAEGFPQPVVSWRKVIGKQPSEYQDLSGQHRGLQVFSNGTLLIRQAQPDLQGLYMCEASNNVGTGVSAVVNLTVHNPPEFEVKSAQVSVRKGAPQTLTCHVLGDEPMAVVWQRDREAGYSIQPDKQSYKVKETKVKGGLLSELYIPTTNKSDSGTYTCHASNPFGRAERVVLLQVQDAPGQPQDVRVLDKPESRQVKLTWLAPQDDRSPVRQYSVQVREEHGASGEWRTRAPVTEQRAVVSDLSPATVYRLRVVAENDLGAGEPSDSVTVRTEGEAPAGEPQNLNVTPTASDTLTVTWDPPPKHLWHGEILGYYVGYREYGLGRPGGYNFSRVEARSNEVGSAVLSDLKKHRKYGVVVQAYNEKGPGPMSQEQVAKTLEDVPSAPPQDLSCDSRTPQSLSLKWQPPPASQQNGLLLGYGVYFENVEEWPLGVIQADTKITSDPKVNIRGLQSFSNYSVRVWAFTGVGDGVRSKPIYCLTDEDVPDAPADMKVVASSSNSLVVSWLPPARPNGKLTGYTVYRRALDSGTRQEQDSAKHRLPPTTTSYEASNLSRGVAYEFWATASTRVGEGLSTSVVFSTITSGPVPAALVSFGQRLSVRRRGTLLLPCVAVGVPPPKRLWSRSDGSPPAGEAFSVTQDGALRINDAQRQHSGNYTCTVANSNGSDQITYLVQVQVAPGAPSLRVSSTASSWVQVEWSVTDKGGSAIRGFLLNFRREEGEWEERALPAEPTSHRLTGLDCGSQYQLQMMAVNAVGSGPASAPLIARTDGGLPGRPTPHDFLEPNASAVGLNLRAWTDNGCPILGFSVQYREKGHEEWLTVASNVQGREQFLLSGLWTGSSYLVRVVARSEAGVTQADYEVTALSLLDGTLSPDSVREDTPGGSAAAQVSHTMYVVYITSLSLVVGVALAFLLVCFRRRGIRQRRNSRIQGPRGGSDGQTMVSMDNKHNMAQREQFYAAVQKGLDSHDRIPDYAEDISPYATFHVATQQQQHGPPASFLYHEQRLAAMETLQLKSGNTREENPKLRGNAKGKCARPDSTAGSDYSGSTDQWSEIGPCRTDRIPLQALVYGGPPQGAAESSSSAEQSPVQERRARHPHHPHPGRHRAQHHGRRAVGGDKQGRWPVGRIEPPSGFSDGVVAQVGHCLEASEAECDMDTLHRIKSRAIKVDQQRQQQQQQQQQQRSKRHNHFTIAV